MNDCKPPQPKNPEVAESGRSLGILGRMVVCGLAWLPFLVLIAFFVSKFEALFSRLQDDAELPAVTEWLLWFTSLNKTLFFLPCLLMILFLVGADVALARVLRHSGRKRLYRAWFAGVIAMGILAVALVAIALLLPVLKMSESI